MAETTFKQLYDIKVIYADGRPDKFFQTGIAGGSMSTEQLIAMFKDRNRFPGASRVEVALATGLPPKGVAEALARARASAISPDYHVVEPGDIQPIESHEGETSEGSTSSTGAIASKAGPLGDPETLGSTTQE